MKARAAATSRAFGYVRVSTDAQRDSGLGIEAQRAAIAQTAARLQLPCAGIYTDAGLSGSLSIDERPGLADALNVLRRGDVLICAKRDRISRDVLHAIVIERAALKKGAKIISAAGEGTETDDSPTAGLMRRIADAFSEYERLMIGLRTRAALRAKRARGERAGTVPYGFKVNGNRVTLYEHEPEQQILTVIADGRAAQRSLRAIAAELNAKGFRTRTGSAWRYEYIRSLTRTIDRHAPDIAR